MKNLFFPLVLVFALLGCTVKADVPFEKTLKDSRGVCTSIYILHACQGCVVYYPSYRCDGDMKQFCLNNMQGLLGKYEPDWLTELKNQKEVDE